MLDDTPVLLTPGPLTTSERTRAAATRDHGSWDADFGRLTRDVCDRLLRIVGDPADAVCVPMQGSGTFSVEAAVRTLVGPGEGILVLANGAYGERLATLARMAGRRVEVLRTATDTPPAPADVAAALDADPGLGVVAVIHCETTTGLLNPVETIADVAHARGRRVIIDAMSSFAVVDVPLAHPAVDAVVAASGKGLEALPGVGFVFLSSHAVETRRGRCDSHSLDLIAQHDYLVAHGRWRFTPPTHVVASLREALLQYEEEGGREARHARYRANSDALVEGMEALGLRLYLPEELRTPIIHTFYAPEVADWSFPRFYDAVRARGFILYPGKLTDEETFRVGCIGAIDADTIREAVAAVAEAFAELGYAPVPATA
ncbi:2-aminoethylphosphonate--pyruvate transaminase [Demequina pelophila]|uniref:2-aminoethylphosphonate--pyruvate transaminase n=1 Tax=Demequina pelophila TaxID=1638984 RepID=UPI00078090FE|nr:2-aminoethylphosphonate--pyruvate transaminase [Demequina pelophila]